MVLVADSNLAIAPVPVSPPQKPSLAGLSREGLRAALASVGVPEKQLRMRVNQLWSWIYVRGIASFEAMSDVSKELRASLADRLSQVPGVALVPISALGNHKLDRLAAAVLEAYDTWNRRVPTAALNRWLAEALARHAPPAARGRRIKIRFMTQPSARPPTFVAFCSQPDDLPKSYLRYLSNSLREAFKLPGVPLRFNLRKGDNPYAKHKA